MHGWFSLAALRTAASAKNSDKHQREFPRSLLTVSMSQAASPLPQLPGSMPEVPHVPDTSHSQTLKCAHWIYQGRDDGERRSSAITVTDDSTRGRGSGVGGGRGGEEEPIEAELRLPEYGGPFSDYSEIVLQYGYITMFASALPIVTFFAIAEVLLQIRTDRWVRNALCFSRTIVPRQSSAKATAQALLVLLLLLSLLLLLHLLLLHPLAACFR